MGSLLLTHSLHAHTCLILTPASFSHTCLTPADDDVRVCAACRYNVCIFAYGQTGSGKTHTMEGPAEDPGVNTRALKELFRLAHERSDTEEISISCCLLEIYNETIRDLLVEHARDTKLEVRLGTDGKVSSQPQLNPW